MDKEFETVAKAFEALGAEIYRLREDNAMLRGKIQGMAQDLDRRTSEIFKDGQKVTVSEIPNDSKRYY